MPDSPPIASLDDLLAPFHAAETPRHAWVVGTEAEKFGVTDDGLPIPYEGPRSVQTVLERLVERHGWIPTPEYEGGALIAMRRGRASVTLEPGGQLELSGAPLDTVHQTCSEFRGHMAELHSVSEDLGITWLGLGFHPFARQEDLTWVPKLRYGVMREYLPTRGTMGVDMMRRTCTVQANLDYESEQDAIAKLRVALRATPIVAAMFANSPWVEGRATGERSHRTRVWLNVDPDRTGMLPFAYGEGASYRAYVEWALDAPMFMVKRDKEVVRNTGQTFRAFLADGYEGHRATALDWETHLNTLFPEVRLKSTLEVRGTDSQSTHMICALPALWKGLLYDATALDAAAVLLDGLGYEELEASRADVADHALRAKLGGREIGEWASELLSIASSGLERLGQLNGAGDDERVHLTPLHELLANNESPADRLLAGAKSDRPDPRDVLELARI